MHLHNKGKRGRMFIGFLPNKESIRGAWAKPMHFYSLGELASEKPSESGRNVRTLHLRKPLPLGILRASMGQNKRPSHSSKTKTSPRSPLNAIDVLFCTHPSAELARSAVVMLACLVDAVARSDRDDRASGANKKNLQNYGATDDEEKKQRGQRRGIRCRRREAQYRTWIREERRLRRIGHHRRTNFDSCSTEKRQ